jgi:hypothetical protein
MTAAARAQQELRVTVESIVGQYETTVHQVAPRAPAHRDREPVT